MKKNDPLVELLLKVLPKDFDGQRTLTSVAKELDLTHQAVYAWVSRHRVPPQQVTRILRAAQGRITREDIFPWVCVE